MANLSRLLGAIPASYKPTLLQGLNDEYLDLALRKHHFIRVHLVVSKSLESSLNVADANAVSISRVFQRGHYLIIRITECFR